MLYTAADFPDIDLLVISHDHWDHLDYSAVTGLLSKVKQVVCPLGVDGHLVGWGFPDEIVHELDWFEEYRLDERLTVCLTPSRHFSGRLFKGNHTLWGGFAFMFKKDERFSTAGTVAEDDFKGSCAAVYIEYIQFFAFATKIRLQIKRKIKRKNLRLICEN